MKEKVANLKFEDPSKENPVVVLKGDTRNLIKKFPDNLFQCVITSPPYWGVRDYGVKNQIGAEMDIDDYISKLVAIFTDLKRVLKKTGHSG